MTWEDPIIKEVREARDKIAAAHGNDVITIGRYYQEKQKQEAQPPVVLPAKRPGHRGVGKSI